MIWSLQTGSRLRAGAGQDDHSFGGEEVSMAELPDWSHLLGAARAGDVAVTE